MSNRPAQSQSILDSGLHACFRLRMLLLFDPPRQAKLSEAFVSP